MVKHKRHILVVRLSALGDAAMVWPVLKCYALSHPDTLFTFAGPPLLAPLFSGVENIEYLPTQKRQKATNLFRQLHRCHPDYVVDLHRVLRTLICDLMFVLSGVKVAIVKKDRKGRRSLIAHRSNIPLTPIQQRYSDALAKILGNQPLQLPEIKANERLDSNEHPSVGIAPFAAHKGKEWGDDRIASVIKELTLRDVNIRLFYGANERSHIDQILHKSLGQIDDKKIYLEGEMPFDEQLSDMTRCRVLLTMDSANLHIATCLGVPVISLWGATHTNLGFYPQNQDISRAIGKDIPCRPCSAFGQKPCKWSDYRCMAAIGVNDVIDKIVTYI